MGVQAEAGAGAAGLPQEAAGGRGHVEERAHEPVERSEGAPHPGDLEAVRGEGAGQLAALADQPVGGGAGAGLGLGLGVPQLALVALLHLRGAVPELAAESAPAQPLDTFQRRQGERQEPSGLLLELMRRQCRF